MTMSTSEDTVTTAVSSMYDPKASPSSNTPEQQDASDDLQTSSEYSTAIDVTVREASNKEMFIDSSGLDYRVICPGLNQWSDFVESWCKKNRIVKSNTDLLKEAGYVTAENSPSRDSVDLESNGSQLKPTPATALASISSTLSSSRGAETDGLVNIIEETLLIAAIDSSQYRPLSQNLNCPQFLRWLIQTQSELMTYYRQQNRDLSSTIKTMKRKQNITQDEFQTIIGQFMSDVDILLQRQTTLEEVIQEKNQCIKQMIKHIEKCEESIITIINKRQSHKLLSKKAQNKLTMEKNQALEHLSSIESSFKDLLAKYEKCKLLVLQGEDEEQLLQKTVDEHEVGIKKYEEVYNKLKQVTKESLTKASETLENVHKNRNVEIKKLNAITKMYEITISSLKAEMAQKEKEIRETAEIIDQLLQ